MIEFTSRGEDAGWKAVASLAREELAEESDHPKQSNPMAAKVVAWCLMVCGLMMFSLILVNESAHGILAGFGAILFLIAGIIFFMIRRPASKPLNHK